MGRAVHHGRGRRGAVDATRATRATTPCPAARLCWPGAAASVGADRRARPAGACRGAARGHVAHLDGGPRGSARPCAPIAGRWPTRSRWRSSARPARRATRCWRPPWRRRGPGLVTFVSRRRRGRQGAAGDRRGRCRCWPAAGPSTARPRPGSAAGSPAGSRDHPRGGASNSPGREAAVVARDRRE